jgi:hypothetical protein
VNHIFILMTFWQQVMGLDLDAFRRVLTLESAPSLTLLLVVIAGLSYQLGQSVILIVNRVTPPRFMLSISLGVLSHLINIIVWSVTTWGLARIFLPLDISFYSVLSIIGLSQAPLVLGILSFVPFFGIALGWVVAGYSLLLAWLGMSILTDGSIALAAIPVAGGWVILNVIQRVFGRPFTEMSQKMRARAAGLEQLRDEIVPADLIEQFAARVENEHGSLT